MKSKVTKYKPKFDITLSAEEVIHLEAALDYARSAPNVSEMERLTACFGVYDEQQSDELMFRLWQGFSKLREDVMLSGGLDDE